MEEVGGRLGWRVILNTTYREKANSRVLAKQRAGEKVKYLLIPAKLD